MPHLRLYVPEEWLASTFQESTGFDAKRLLDRLVQVVADFKMPDPKRPGADIPMINLSNLKHAIIPLRDAHMAGDENKRFLHCTLAAGNDTPGRTAQVRSEASYVLGDAIDEFTKGLPGLGSVTVWIQDIDRDRGYTTTFVRKRRRGADHDMATDEHGEH